VRRKIFVLVLNSSEIHLAIYAEHKPIASDNYFHARRIHIEPPSLQRSLEELGASEVLAHTQQGLVALLPSGQAL
jgi:hypothetical protein